MHLFLLVPNNSGSSILHELIATSNSVATLPVEGQFCKQFIGPNPINLNVKHIFTEKEEIFANVKNYEWKVIKNEWEMYWQRSRPNAPIKLEKSPPNILRAEMLKGMFLDCKFIMMIRNPYAVVEGILRGNPAANLDQAARHAVRVLEIQLENSEKYLNDLVLRYEDLTENTLEYCNRIMNFLGIADIVYDKDFNVKGYVSTVRNMNKEQIKRLTKNQIVEINKIFKEKENVLKECGYEIIENIDFNFKQVGECDAQSWINKLQKIDNEIWNSYTYRQETFDVHQKTNTIPLIFSEDFNSENIVYRDLFNEFADDLMSLNKIFTNKFGFGYITRAILVKLQAGEEIPTHVDSGESLDKGHRTHIPLITNEHCYFTVGDETINMKIGEMWEINNTNKKHSVSNKGSEDRVHLIVDWVVVDE